jgi:hypothetical protein
MAVSWSGCMAAGKVTDFMLAEAGRESARQALQSNPTR